MSSQVTARPKLKLLSEWLKEPDVPLSWLIDGWMLAKSRILTYAQFKAGKTTLIANLLRSLADGDPFLGEAVATALNPTETVVLLDFEMSENQLKDWLRIQNIQNPSRVAVRPLRGAARSFNILNSQCRSEWAEDLRQCNCTFLIVDCIGPVMSALDLDENNNSEEAKFLRLIDELLVESGVDNCWVVHHMGHDQKRPRGASAIRGWCDVEITLTRRGDLSTGQRSISAVGRDVSQVKRDLLYDPVTHRFTLAPPTQLNFVVGPSPKTKAAESALIEILAILQPPSPPLGVRRLTDLLRQKGFGFHENTVRQAVGLGVSRGDLKRNGPANSQTYSLP